MKKKHILPLSLALCIGGSTFPSPISNVQASERSNSQSMLEPIVDHVNVVAHRGASAYAPEHTKEAYEMAIRMQADFVEIDLHMTKDGQLVAIHDSSLKRTTNVEEVFPDRAPWLVKDFTLAEIKRLDAGSWFSEAKGKHSKKKYRGQKILTLDEAIRIIQKKNKKTALFIETKSPKTYPGMEEKLVKILERTGYLKKDRLILQSFSEESLRKLQPMIPEDVPLIQLYTPSMLKGKNLDEALAEAAEYAEGIGPDKSLVTPILMQEAHERMLTVQPYTVNTKDEMVEQLSLGVDGIITNNPDHAVELENRPYISHGAASGEVTDTSAVLWARSNEPSLLKFEISQDPRFKKKPIVKKLKAEKENDSTAQVKVDGLTPNTVYHYRVKAHKGSNEVAGTFKTAPDGKAEEPLTLVWGGDTGGQGNIPPFKSFSAMADLNPDFFLFSGDTIYADNPTPAVPDGSSKTIEDFRAKYKENRTDPHLRKLLQSTSTYAIWDDHEVINDFSGPSEPLTSTGLKAFTEYWPLLKENSDPSKLFHKYSWGNTLDLIVLNNRGYRDPNTQVDGPDKTMLGKEQLNWLKQELIQSDAKVKLVASSVPISIPTGKVNHRDGWANADHIDPNDPTGYETEFKQISDFILQNEIKNVNFVTTDVHYADMIQYDPDRNGSVDYRELVSGPLGAVMINPPELDPTFGPERLYAEGGFFNFGVLKVDPKEEQMTVEIRDENGNVHYKGNFPIEK
ncbi:glycerophosphodiester phosphodiesterase [Domibacillus epiphyticus]|uniref:Glycerophosphodiester phosphodiesterase n=1 Tax=Domibacillus epiphyticus TaxID=1714355 RepID=A0A1V2A8X3_9BACI|nr:glycerophosphodiester phosphodiesterase [Domibacillus epiphyticus]